MASIKVYSSCDTIEVDCYIYTDAELTTPLTSTYISDGTYKYELDSNGKVLSKVSCS